MLLPLMSELGCAEVPAADPAAAPVPADADAPGGLLLAPELLAQFAEIMLMLLT